MTGVGLLAPWVLAALAAAALPLIAHLARAQPREGRGFPSLMFLKRVPFPSRARRHVRDRGLLALRLLALGRRGRSAPGARHGGAAGRVLQHGPAGPVRRRP
jgi:hypothetical protein